MTAKTVKITVEYKIETRGDIEYHEFSVASEKREECASSFGWSNEEDNVELFNRSAEMMAVAVYGLLKENLPKQSKKKNK